MQLCHHLSCRIASRFSVLWSVTPTWAPWELLPPDVFRSTLLPTASTSSASCLTPAYALRTCPSFRRCADASTTSTAVTSLPAAQQHQQLSSTTGRQLKQNAFCPDGCLDSASCVQDATMGGLRCQKCKNNLRVSMINGMCSKWLIGQGLGCVGIACQARGTRLCWQIRIESMHKQVQVGKTASER